MAAAPPVPAAHVTRTGYMGFGSFFTPNVEDMIRDAQFVAPELPFTPPDVDRAAGLEFGDACKQLFMASGGGARARAGEG